MPRPASAPIRPLKPAVLHILLALSEGERHGLGIADSIESQTDGDLRIGPGTLYRSLKEMSRAGLVRPADSAAGADPRRKYYKITETGLRTLHDETARLERIVEAARSRRVLSGSA